MKNLTSILTLIVLLIVGNSANAQTDNPNYDPELAEKLHADEYGMRSYVLVILTTPKDEPQNKALRDSSFAGHMANMGKMVEKDQLVVAGPLGPNEKGYRGIFILNSKTPAEAREILQSDPAIKNGFLDVELFPWYGSAALPVYLPTSEKIWKKGM